MSDSIADSQLGRTYPAELPRSTPLVAGFALSISPNQRRTSPDQPWVLIASLDRDAHVGSHSITGLSRGFVALDRCRSIRTRVSSVARDRLFVECHDAIAGA